MMTTKNKKVFIEEYFQQNRIATHILTKIADRLTGPLLFSWDLTNKCNFSCLHCLNRSGDSIYHDFDQELSINECFNLCDQIIDIYPASVCICGGEPLLHNHFFEIISKLSKKIQSVNMVSNGYVIDNYMARKIAYSGVKMVQISLDSNSNAEHNRFRATTNSYEKALDAVSYLSEYDNLQLAVAFCPTKYNIENFEKYVQLIMDAGCNIIRIMPLLPLGRGLDNYRIYCPSQEQYFLLVSKIKRLKTNNQGSLQIEWGDPLEHLHRPLYGYKQVIMMEVRSNGDISPSLYLPFCVGNIRRHTLRRYWDAGFNSIWDYDFIKTYIKSCLSVDDFGLNTVKAWTHDRLRIDLVDDFNKLKKNAMHQ